MMKHSITDKLMTAVGFIVLAAVTAYIIIGWSAIPDEIPSHYNMAGEVDGNGGKGLLIFLLFLAWGQWLMLQVIAMVPQIWNTGVEVNRRNQEKVYRIVKTMLEILKLFMALHFSYMIFCIAASRPFFGGFMAVFLVSIFGTLTVSVIRLLRNR